MLRHGLSSVKLNLRTYEKIEMSWYSASLSLKNFNTYINLFSTT